MKMARAFALFAIYSLVASFVSAQNEEDNIVDLLRSIINTVADSYTNSNGVISIPDTKGASQGVIGNLIQIQRDPIACYAAPITDNPRNVDYRFRLPYAVAKYEKYQVHMLSPIRTVTYAIHDLDFAVKGAIEIRDTGCKFVLQKVEVVSTASTKNPQVTGGFLPFMNDILSGFMKNSVNTIIEHVRQDIETRIRTIIVDGSFKCATYQPSQLFFGPQPNLEQPQNTQQDQPQHSEQNPPPISQPNLPQYTEPIQQKYLPLNPPQYAEQIQQQYPPLTQPPYAGQIEQQYPPLYPPQNAVQIEQQYPPLTQPQYAEQNQLQNFQPNS